MHLHHPNDDADHYHDGNVEPDHNADDLSHHDDDGHNNAHNHYHDDHDRKEHELPKRLYQYRRCLRVQRELP